MLPLHLSNESWPKRQPPPSSIFHATAILIVEGEAKAGMVQVTKVSGSGKNNSIPDGMGLHFYGEKCFGPGIDLNIIAAVGLFRTPCEFTRDLVAPDGVFILAGAAR
jgi:hypothetical protein